MDWGKLDPEGFSDKLSSLVQLMQIAVNLGFDNMGDEGCKSLSDLSNGLVHLTLLTEMTLNLENTVTRRVLRDVKVSRMPSTQLSRLSIWSCAPLVSLTWICNGTAVGNGIGGIGCGPALVALTEPQGLDFSATDALAMAQLPWSTFEFQLYEVTTRRLLRHVETKLAQDFFFVPG